MSQQQGLLRANCMFKFFKKLGPGSPDLTQINQSHSGTIENGFLKIKRSPHWLRMPLKKEEVLMPFFQTIFSPQNSTWRSSKKGKITPPGSVSAWLRRKAGALPCLQWPFPAILLLFLGFHWKWHPHVDDVTPLCPHPSPCHLPNSGTVQESTVGDSHPNSCNASVVLQL